MKYYTSTTEFNCGIDLHARQMYVCLMDRTGKKLVHTNIKNNDFEYFLKRVAPYRHDLTVCCECMFGWYWLADACQAAGLKFVLAHALYLKVIHGGKNKNDRIDSEKRKDEAKFNGDYRTKRVILEIYDALTGSMQSGRPYQTILGLTAQTKYEKLTGGAN
jgi:transposase